MSIRLVAIACVLLVFAALGPIAAHAQVAYPDAQCSLNPDKSSLIVTASNGDAKKYACAASCRYKAAGQHPIQTFDCNFSLSPNAAEKVVCQLAGDGPKFFSELLPTRMQCEPR